MKDDWQYIRTHAGRLLWSEVTAVFTPGRRRDGEHEDGKGLMNSRWMHMAWHVAKPFAYRWIGSVGWKAVKHMFHKKS